MRSSRSLFEILELKFHFVNEHFNISKVMKKFILVKNAKIFLTLMKNQLQLFVENKKLFKKKDKILVAVSGGADSVVLLDLLVNAGYTCAIAHCNFQLRDEESDNDQKFVKELSVKYGLALFVNSFETEKIASQKNISIEMAARELRYKWFNELVQQHNYQYIATAHHKNDSVETLLLNLARGTGLKGLTGIPLKNNNIVRPLLFANKSQILEHCKKFDLQFRLDKTNLQSIYNRNKVRNKIIPLFEEINPAFQQNISNNINRFQEIQQIFTIEINNKKNTCIKKDKSNVFIDINKLLYLKPLRTYLFEFLRPYNFSNQIIDNIILAINSSSGKQFFSSTHRLVKDRNNFIITEIKNTTDKEYQIYDNQKNIIINEKQNDELILNIKKYLQYNDFKINRNKKYAYLDLDKLEFPLVLRKWKTGDYFYPFGMKKRKKISDFFIDQKFSLLEKENTWLLTSNNLIVWVVGHRIDNRFAIKNNSKVVEFFHNFKEK